MQTKTIQCACIDETLSRHRISDSLAIFIAMQFKVTGTRERGRERESTLRASRQPRLALKQYIRVGSAFLIQQSNFTRFSLLIAAFAAKISFLLIKICWFSGNLSSFAGAKKSCPMKIRVYTYLVNLPVWVIQWVQHIS